MKTMRVFRSLFLPLIAAAALLMARSAVAEPPPRVRPKAFVIAFAQYQAGLENLAFSLPSGCKMAGALMANGYDVTFLTDRTSGGDERVAALNAAPPAKESKPNRGRSRTEGSVTVVMADTATDLESEFRKWMETNFPVGSGGSEQLGGKAPFGIVTYVGHGVRRGGTDILLTPDATEQAGGTAAATLVAGHGDSSPLICVFDMCRNDVEGAAEVNAPQWNNDALVLFSNAPGRATPDAERSLTWWLADGLSHEDRTFRAKKYAPLGRERLGIYETAMELPVFVWFNYAIVQRLTGENNLFSHQLMPTANSRHQSRVIASLDPQYQFEKPIELIGEWNQFALAPNSDIQANVGPNSVQITRTKPFVGANGVGSSGLATSFLGVTQDGQQREFPSQGKAILMEMEAIPGPMGAPGKPLMCNIAPGNNAVKGGELVKPDTTMRLSRPIPYGKKILLMIPFDNAAPDKVFNSVAVGTAVNNPADWPLGATLLVTRLDLLNPATIGKAMPLIPEGNVLRRLLVSSPDETITARYALRMESTPEEKDEKPEEKDEGSKKKAKRLEPLRDPSKLGIQIRCAQPEAGVVRPIHCTVCPQQVVSQHVVLQASFDNVLPPPEKESCEVTITLSSFDRPVGSATFSVNKKIAGRPFCLEFSEECACDSLTIQTDAAAIRVEALVLVERDKVPNNAIWDRGPK